MPFLVATLPHIFGIEKGHAVKKLLNSAKFRGCAEVFTKPKNVENELLVAGERTFVDI